MNLKVIQLISAGIIFVLPSLMGIIETKRFDAKPKERLKYLNYMMPKELRFSAPAIEADRGNLLVIVSEPSPVSSNIIEVESNQSAEPSFPVVSYDDAETTETFDLNSDNPDSSRDINDNVSIDEALPLADPFEEMSNSSVNSTDDLLDVFENTTFPSGSNRNSGMIIPFIPPYSSMPDNLTITNQSTYRRVQR
jgi:hypothetical protein